MYAYKNKSTETEKQTGRGKIIRALSLLHHCILFYPGIQKESAEE